MVQQERIFGDSAKILICREKYFFSKTDKITVKDFETFMTQSPGKAIIMVFLATL
jgi:hypothetical protein